MSGTRLLAIGPVPPNRPSASNPIGGAAVNFSEMVRCLEERGFVISVIDISRPRVNVAWWSLGYHNSRAVWHLTTRLIVLLPKSQIVILNLSAGAAFVVGGLVSLLCRAFRRPVVLRIFGGDFGMQYDGRGRIGRWLANKTFMRSKLVLVQTQELFRRFQDWGNFMWFANARDVVVRHPGRPREAVQRLLFVSQLRMEKGLKEALTACRTLPNHCYLNVYGPVMPNTELELFRNHAKAKYRGVIHPEDIPDVLVAHDVLLLPSYWKSEGYPGIAIEAMQCGIPVIATKWRSIPEVVEDGKSGLLVEPRSTEELRLAIERVVNDVELYRRLCKGAVERGKFFRSGVWYDRLAKELASISQRG